VKLESIKSLFLKAMLGCLIAAAALAVVTILIGRFNDLTEKALLTILLIALHCLLSFGFIVNNEKQETFENLAFFTNVTFGLIVASFITSTFGVWQVLPGDLVGRLYALYFVLLFATLHAEILAKIRGIQTTIDRVVLSNFVFMALVVALLVPVIFVDNSLQTLGAFYFRGLAAAGIVDATLTLTAIILHKLYLRKNPRVNDAVFKAPLIQPNGQTAPAATSAGGAPAATQATPQTGMNLFVKILIVYVVFQLVFAVIGFGLDFFLR
jgi:hypothetical protein